MGNEIEISGHWSGTMRQIKNISWCAMVFDFYPTHCVFSKPLPRLFEKQKFSKNRWIKIIYHLEQWGILHVFDFCFNNGCISFLYWQQDKEHKRLFKFYVREKKTHKLIFILHFCGNQFKTDIIIIDLSS